MKNKTTYHLDYFKGVFETYALQNDPGVNVSYHFDIDDFSIEGTQVEALKKKFDYFQAYEFEFSEITRTAFEEVLNRWLYAEFQPNYIKNTSTMTVIQQIVDDLVASCHIDSFYKMASLTRDGKNAENEFGYATDFIVLTSATKRYFCEFTVG
ncbi:hypothetical protein [Kordia sp.]|uniref:hypothetical protein n=1 Tax=Kordia sp. TaxID=1965332 RepID=UPI003B58F06B